MNGFMLFLLVAILIAIIVLVMGIFLVVRNKDNDETENIQVTQSKKKTSVPLWVYILVTIVIVGGFCLLLFPPGDLASNSGTVTMDKYNQIQTGMTYQQVAQIIGSPGEEMSRVDMAGYLTIMYMWQNNDGSNMNAMFQNNALVTKAQFGLE